MLLVLIGIIKVDILVSFLFIVLLNYFSVKSCNLFVSLSW